MGQHFLEKTGSIVMYSPNFIKSGMTNPSDIVVIFNFHPLELFFCQLQSLGTVVSNFFFSLVNCL